MMSIKNISRNNALEVFQFIDDRLKNKLPTSLIRLGDGEGALLGYPKYSTRSDIDRSLVTWFGHTDCSNTQVESLTKQLKRAVASADIVGLPRIKQLSKHPMYGAVLSVIDEYDLISDNMIITDAAVHRYLQFTLYYRNLLAGRDFLGLLTSRNISGKLRAYFNIAHIDTYLIKGESQYPGNVLTPHFPDRFETLEQELKVPYIGALFLVGAGALGKIYCQWIKNKGGVAIDIGSIFDSWAGVPSRLTHPCHNLEVYNDNPVISRDEAIVRFNRLCNRFSIDSQRLAHSNQSVLIRESW